MTSRGQMQPDAVTVCVPSIPPRLGVELPNLIQSIGRQTRPAEAISIAVDTRREGAAATRQRALDAVQTPYVAFVDDDDLLYPNHLEVLHRLAAETGADYVWSWFDGNNPFPQHRGRQMDPANPHHTTMTVMVRTEVAKRVGFTNHPAATDQWPGEDWNFILGCVAVGASFAHIPEITWTYKVHGNNTGGLPRW
jgi:glycosyltransferase involved in cell wall biosynthesis